MQQWEGIQVFQHFIDAREAKTIEDAQACAIGGALIASGCIDIIRAYGTRRETHGEGPWLIDKKLKKCVRVVFRNPTTGEAEESPAASSLQFTDKAAVNWMRRHWELEAKPGYLKDLRPFFGNDLARWIRDKGAASYTNRPQLKDEDVRVFVKAVRPGSRKSQHNKLRDMESLALHIRKGNVHEAIYALNDRWHCSPAQVADILSLCYGKVNLIPICNDNC